MLILVIYMASMCSLESLALLEVDMVWIELGYNRELLERTTISRIACYGIG